MIARLLLALVAATVAARPTKKGDPMSPSTWASAPATYEGKPVRTTALLIEEPGLVAADAPAAAVRILCGNEKGEEGGPIIVVMPADKFESFTKTYSQRNKGKGGSFGAVARSRVIEATYVTIQGERALAFQLPPASLQGLAKPSELLAAQLRAATGEQLKDARAGWTRKPFLVSQLDQRGKPETTRELQRLADLANAKAAKDKEPRTSVRELTDRAKSGERILIEDPKAKVEWLVTAQ
jgi:hypothetical protein